MQRFPVLLAAAITLSGVAHANDQPASAPSTVAASEDPFLWLEDIDGDRSLAWVKAQNLITATRFMDSPEFARARDRILEVLDSDARIPYPERIGDHLYNFWQDKANPRGIWRRTTLDEYRKQNPQWETLIDIDALNRAESATWVFKGADCLKSDYKLCLVSLSPGGGDAVEVREFDLASKSFVKDGFRLPAAKTQAGWIDEDNLYVATDFGPGSMTDSSYPRIVKEWKRGTPLSAAQHVHEGNHTDLAVSASHDRTPGFERDFVYVTKDFFHTEIYQRKAGKLVRIDVPTDADMDAHREWMLVKPRSPWAVGGTTYPAGSLLATKFDDFMAGKRAFTVLFEPDERTSLASWTWTKHRLVLDELHDVTSRIEVLAPGEGDWAREFLATGPLGTTSVIDTDPDNSDEIWLATAGFLTPPTLLYIAQLPQDEPVSAAREVEVEFPIEDIKHAPAFFDASQFEVSQHFVASRDGTRVPYFEIAPKAIRLDGSNRTLLEGYGGFEVSLQPFYSGAVGRAWLERGGVYVVANIRGGGEYGPDWHQAALRENRHRAYEDFAAIAQDLARRGVTSARHLGAEGGSNGGLLVGNMLTHYPHLFGAIVCEVPLLDMKRYSHLSAGASWMAEYGDPDTADWDFIKDFSPYHNVKAGTHYPPVLFYTTTSDDRVGPVQARKMAAKMIAMELPGVWFYENLEGGHGGGADNKQAATMHALAYDFLWDQLK